MMDTLIGGAAVVLFLVIFTFVNIQKAKTGWSFTYNKQEDKK